MTEAPRSPSPPFRSSSPAGIAVPEKAPASTAMMCCVNRRRPCGHGVPAGSSVPRGHRGRGTTPSLRRRRRAVGRSHTPRSGSRRGGRSPSASIRRTSPHHRQTVAEAGPGSARRRHGPHRPRMNRSSALTVRGWTTPPAGHAGRSAHAAAPRLPASRRPARGPAPPAGVKLWRTGTARRKRARQAPAGRARSPRRRRADGGRRAVAWAAVAVGDRARHVSRRGAPTPRPRGRLPGRSPRGSSRSGGGGRSWRGCRALVGPPATKGMTRWSLSRL